MIFDSDKKQLLYDKLAKLLKPVSFDGSRITIGSKSFIIPKEPDREIASRNTLSR